MAAAGSSQPAPPGSRLHLGFHAPLPPARTGVADYAAALADGLKDHVEVAVNPIEPCSVELYHLGNNALHRAIYRRALERPGVAVLHDAVLHQFLLGTLTEESYVEEFVYNYGEWNRDLARELWAGRGRSAQDPIYFRYPMLRRVAATAQAMIVHNPAAARAAREHDAAGRVVEVPHLFTRPEAPDPVEITRLRARLGVPPSAPLFGVFGYLRESKRLPSILHAFESVRRENSAAALLIAGEFASSDLERALANRLSQAGVHRVGYLPEDEFWLYAQATDVCLNLRHPAAGETSGIAIRLMGIGKTVVVTAAEETSRFPEAACVRVDPGPAEAEMLTASMLWLAREAAARRQIGRKAAEHIGVEHSLERCATRYLEVLNAVPHARVKRPRSLRAY